MSGKRSTETEAMDTIVAGIKEALDSGDLKRALRLCTGALASETHPYLLTFKAVIMFRLNRRVESYKAAVEAQSHVSSAHPNAMNMLITVFKDLRKYSNLAELYERLYEESPSLDTGLKLIEAYSADFRFVEQQVVCMKLFKRFEAQEYAIHAGECLYLAAKSDPRQARMTEIAHLILNKLTRSEDFRCCEAFLRVYTKVLMDTKQYAEVQVCIDRFGGLLTGETERISLDLELAMGQKDYISAANKAQEVIKACESTGKPAWPFYLAYINALFAAVREAMQAKTPLNPNEVLDPTSLQIKFIDSSTKGNNFKPFAPTDSVQMILTLALGNIKSIKDASEASARAKDTRREAYLAELEFKRRLIYLGFPQGTEDFKSEGDPGGVFYLLVFRYATSQYEFSTTPDDLIPYIRLLNVSHVVPFREKMKEFLAYMKEHSTNKIRVLKSLVVGLKVMRLIGVFSPPVIKHHGQIWDIVKWIYAEYVEALRVEQPPAQGETRIADELILLSCEILLQPYISPALDPADLRKSDFSQYQFAPESGPLTQRLLHSLALLEFALIQSPFAQRLKLALVDLYVRVGALETAHRLLLSMELGVGEFEKLAHLVYGPMRDFCVVMGELEQLGKRVIANSESLRERRVTQMHDAYTRHSLSEILELRSLCLQQDKSLFTFLSKVSFLELDVFRKLEKGPLEVGKVLRESLELLGKMCALRSGDSDLESMVDESLTYYVGVVQVQSLVYKSAKAKYDLGDFEMANRAFVKKDRVVSSYGWKAEYRAVALKGTILKLYLDAVEGNSEMLDSDLRIYARQLDEQGLITDPTEKIAQLKHSVSLLNTKEAAQKAQEILSSQVFYQGHFPTDEDLKLHKRHISGLLAKYQLMLLEGLWRVMKGHASFRREGGGGVEVDPVLRLTEWRHISRHFDVLEMMGRELVEGLIPRDDFLQFQMLKVGEAFDSSESIPLHPGLLPLISEAITGAFTTLTLLQPLYFQALASASTRLLDNPDTSEIDSMRTQLQHLYSEMYKLMSYLEKYLEIQTNMCLLSDKMREITTFSSFQAYSGGLDPAFFTRISTNLRQSHEWALRVLIDALKTELRTVHG